MTRKTARKLPVGAEVRAKEGVHFRVWSPRSELVEVAIEGSHYELKPEPDGYFSGFLGEAKAGQRYRLRLNREGEFPDPASRFQPGGPHGPSEIIDPEVFEWTDGEWKGCALPGQVVYELHVGTFTQEGVWDTARAELPYLRDLGISLIEVMPVAEFPGRFGWGYDGVNLFAPTRLYGTPDHMRAFVNRAHELGIGVILDVVYNHLGPDGNYLGQFSGAYFNSKHKTDWGEAIAFDGENSAGVREFYLANVRYWIEEFHLDGLRLDATQDIHDESEDHILAAMVREARQAAGPRSVVILAENEPQHTRLARPPERDGYGIDGLWNDDLHHSAMVALTGSNDAYYTDYCGSPQEFVSAAKYGYLFQGQRYQWQKKRRGAPSTGLHPSQFVNFLQNHDQIANSAKGERIHSLAAPGMLRALTAYFLLIPGTPMLFQGQEFAASSPFLFFADHGEDLGKLVWSGRKEFLRQWRRLQMPEMQELVIDPSDPATFQSSKLDHRDREKNAAILALHRDAIRLRREDPTLRAQQPGCLDGAVLGGRSFVLRFFAGGEGDRLLLVNLGVDHHLSVAPEPLLAPPERCEWDVLFSTEWAKYGGHGTPPLDTADNWRIPGFAAVLLHPVAADGEERE